MYICVCVCVCVCKKEKKKKKVLAEIIDKYEQREREICEINF